MTDYSVYIMKCENYYKIGFSKRLDDRVKVFSTSSPFICEIVHAIFFDNISDAKLAEKLAHQELKILGFHHKLEWFNCDKDTAIKVCEDVAKIAKSKYIDKQNSIKSKAINLLKILKTEVICEILNMSPYEVSVILEKNNLKLKDAIKINLLFKGYLNG